MLCLKVDKREKGIYTLLRGDDDNDDFQKRLFTNRGWRRELQQKRHRRSVTRSVADQWKEKLHQKGSLQINGYVSDINPRIAQSHKFGP